MFDELLQVVANLRKQCPWDREQDIQTTRPLILNEAYELDEAIGAGDVGHMTEELGDYLFMGIFFSEVLRTEHGVLLEDAIEGVVTKLKSRHPHVYSKGDAQDASAVLTNWERIKRTEKHRQHNGGRQSILDGIPASLPALKTSQLLQERCRRVGFDWTSLHDVFGKVVEEIEELREEVATRSESTERISEELGDLLFALTNLARHLGIDAESALRDGCAKFSGRFRKLEETFALRNRPLGDATLEEMDEVWEQIKRDERGGR